MKHSYLAALLLGAGLLAGSPVVEAQNIIPRPSSYTAATGSFTFTSGTKVACENLPPPAASASPPAPTPPTA